MAAKDKSTPCWVVILEHFSGQLDQSELLGVYTDLEAAKKLQKSYESFTRIYPTIYRGELFESKPKRTRKLKECP